MDDTNKRKWAGTTSGSTWMHRSLIQMLRFIPLRAIYWFAAIFVLPFYIIFNRQAVRAIGQYHRGRYNRNGLTLFVWIWKSHYRMMQIVIDRFAVYGGKRFNFEADGNDAFKALECKPGGFITLTSHTGNQELIGYSMNSAIKQMAVLVYGGETASIMENRRKILSKHNIEMIPVDETFNHIFAMNEALANGKIIGMPADRAVGSTKTFNVTFLGTQAQFPLGPFATAVQREVPLIALFMMKEGIKKYRLIVRPVELDNETSTALNKRERMAALGEKYVTILENVVSAYPDQWFNFYDFWNETSN